MNANHLACIAVETPDPRIAKKLVSMIIELETAGFTVVFDHNIHQKLGSIVGYFDAGDAKELWIYTEKDWITTFFHEYGHFKQFLEGSYPDDQRCEMIDHFSDWLLGDDFPDEYIEQAVRVAQDLELDCEKKTVELMAELGMEDIPEYIRSSNSYIFSYEFSRQHRKDVPDGYCAKTEHLMPEHFLEDYTVLPAGFAEALL